MTTHSSRDAAPRERRDAKPGESDPHATVSEGLLVTGPLCTPEEVAELLRISTRTLADWRMGRGAEDTPLPLRIGGSIRYAMRDVNAYLQRQVEAAEARRAAGV